MSDLVKIAPDLSDATIEGLRHHLKQANELLVGATQDAQSQRERNTHLRSELEIATNRIEGDKLIHAKMGSELMRLRRSHADPLVVRELQRQVTEMRAIITGLLRERQGGVPYRPVEAPQIEGVAAV